MIVMIVAQQRYNKWIETEKRNNSCSFIRFLEINPRHDPLLTQKITLYSFNAIFDSYIEFGSPIFVLY